MHSGGLSLPGLLCGLLLLLSLLLAGGAVGGQAAMPRGMPIPMPIRLEAALAQSFTTSIVSSRYGVFSATLDLRASPNFPERLHGELIPAGYQQLKRPEQIPLEHFNHARNAPLPPSSAASLAALLAEAKKISQSNSEASSETAAKEGPHPSLLSLEVRLDFSGSTAGTVSFTTLPPTDKRHSIENENNNEEEEDEEKPPTAQATFAFRGESSSMASSTLSDIPPMVRVATGEVVTNEGAKGTFTFRLFSEHEFSLTLQLPEGKEGVVDHIWVHGYATPNEALFQRKTVNEQPWWYTWAFASIGILVFSMQLLTAYVDAKRENNLRMQQRMIDAETKAKKLK
ncbi:uncharacterized protein TM35_000073830 [Trypanosoma theileri]|uniref:Transmembrane protein n=1 Tax=Trypanosoma theileri TaxID=67003 RepID=A0A1X0P321_9TRYP|nr:uncharacterized protein TM35_000073830 [Trypanosoma theileri]ORC90959.1 hypothetical protein TM35_000073830 [Trypanosoma theileri]